MADEDSPGRSSLISRTFGLAKSQHDPSALFLTGAGVSRQRELVGRQKSAGAPRKSRSLFEPTADENNGSLPGLLVALLTIFDTDGTQQLTRSEWLDGKRALLLETDAEEWRTLLTKMGGADEASAAKLAEESQGADEEALDFAHLVGMFGSRRPVEGYLEDVLRRFMKSLVSLTQTVGDLTTRLDATQAVLDATVLRDARAREQRAHKLIRYWRHQHASVAFDGWRKLIADEKEAKRKCAARWRSTRSKR